MVFLQSLYHVLSISSCSLFLMIMMMMNLVFAAGPTGLTMKLIHRDSPGSPLYPGNLTKLERMERALQRSIHREQSLRSTWQQQMKQVSSMNNSTNNNTNSDIDMVRPLVKYYKGYTYMVELGLGSFSEIGSPEKFPINYYFYFDTGSDLLWLQCDPSFTGHTGGTRYFLQDQDYFDGRYSVTYHPLSYFSEDPICKKYVGFGYPAEGQNWCPYRLRYADGAGSEGVLATEKLTVNVDNGGIEEIKNFVFGCGFRQNEPFFGQDPNVPNPVVGIVGLGKGDASLIRQLRGRAQNKFEYCLKPNSDDDDHPDTHTFLRFGSDTKIVVGGQGVQTTDTFIGFGSTNYYVNMVGISVNGQPIVYPEGSDVFGTRASGTGGCIFDSGTDITILSPESYAPFREYLVTYFSTHGIETTPPRGQTSLLDLCFPSPIAYNVLPIIRFHFRGGAVFEMEPQTTFVQDDEDHIICLAIRPSIDTVSVTIAAFQQVNQRILHDLSVNKISWIKENCVAE